MRMARCLIGESRDQRWERVDTRLSRQTSFLPPRHPTLPSHPTSSRSPSLLSFTHFSTLHTQLSAVLPCAGWFLRNKRRRTGSAGCNHVQCRLLRTMAQHLLSISRPDLGAHKGGHATMSFFEWFFGSS